MSLSFKTLALLAFAAVSVVAETHSVFFNNFCREGTPTLILQDGSIVHDEYTSNVPLVGATAYLNKTGACGAKGEGCTAVKMDLKNPDSEAYISLAAPYAFSVPTGFVYSPCDGVGANCTTPDCADASHNVACNKDDASLVITFCH